MATTSTKSDVRKDTIPEVLTDPGTGKRYLRGRFLGKVSFSSIAFYDSMRVT